MTYLAKLKTKFVCNSCGYEAPKWMGKCPECATWNSMIEEIEQKMTTVSVSMGAQLSNAKPQKLSELIITDEFRQGTGLSELDRVLGGGIVAGSLILVGGDPGIGKSTLLLQISQTLGVSNQKVLYISGEESAKQIKIRASRMDVISDNIYIVAETNMQAIELHIENVRPDIVIIDSIQTMFNADLSSSPGSVGQVREATLAFMKIAKGSGITIFLVGHVTKQGALAGPRVLEHMVDTVLYFEGEGHMSHRILRGVKNRFGSTNEIGMFEMTGEGLKEVKNPSELLLSGRQQGASGTCVVAAMEGTRPMLIEVQALLTSTNFGTPRRNATGTDFNRVNMILAVLEKKIGMQLQNYDSYVNVVGGVRIIETAADLGIAAAIASSFREKTITDDTIIIGEIGLVGEIRAVGNIEKRVIEAEKMGFKTCIIPEYNRKGLNMKVNMKIIGVNTINHMLEVAFD